MTPGIYPDIPNAVYHREIDALSASGLKMLCKSPAHYRDAIDNPPEQTLAMAFGSAFHSYLLQPETFDNEFIVLPDINRRTKAGKEEYAEFVKQAAGKSIVTPEDMETLKAMRESVLKSETVRGIFSNMKVEQSIIWEDPTYGFLCKCRPDIECELINFLWDLKTAQDASPEGFSRDAAKFGYHIQADHYLTGANIAYGKRKFDYFGFIVVEKKPPYAVQTYVADAAFIESGHEKNKFLRNTYHLCRKSNKWPGYPDKILPLSLPAWAA